jgi:hypothetical protein
MEKSMLRNTVAEGIFVFEDYMYPISSVYMIILSYIF